MGRERQEQGRVEEDQRAQRAPGIGGRGVRLVPPPPRGATSEGALQVMHGPEACNEPRADAVSEVPSVVRTAREGAGGWRTGALVAQLRKHAVISSGWDN